VITNSQRHLNAAAIQLGQYPGRRRHVDDQQLVRAGRTVFIGLGGTLTTRPRSTDDFGTVTWQRGRQQRILNSARVYHQLTGTSPAAASSRRIANRQPRQHLRHQQRVELQFTNANTFAPARSAPVAARR